MNHRTSSPDKEKKGNSSAKTNGKETEIAASTATHSHPSHPTNRAISSSSALGPQTITRLQYPVVGNRGGDHHTYHRGGDSRIQGSYVSGYDAGPPNYSQGGQYGGFGTGRGPNPIGGNRTSNTIGLNDGRSHGCKLEDI